MSLLTSAFEKLKRLGMVADVVQAFGLLVTLYLQLRTLRNPWSASFRFLLWGMVAAGLVWLLMGIWYVARHLRRRKRASSFVLCLTVIVLFLAGWVTAPPLINVVHRLFGRDPIGVLLTYGHAPVPAEDELRQALTNIARLGRASLPTQDRRLLVLWDTRLGLTDLAGAGSDQLQHLRRNEGLTGVLRVSCQLDAAGQYITYLSVETESPLLARNPEGLRMEVTGLELPPATTKADVARLIWNLTQGYGALIHYGQGRLDEAGRDFGQMDLPAPGQKDAWSRVLYEEPYIFYVLLNTAYDLERFDLLAPTIAVLKPEDDAPSSFVEHKGSVEEIALDSLQNALNHPVELKGHVLLFVKLLLGKVHVRLGHVGPGSDAEELLESVRNSAADPLTAGRSSRQQRLASDPDAWLARADILMNDYDGAHQRLEAAIAAEPDSWLLHLELGRLLLGTGESDLAVVELARASRLAPRSPVVKTWYAMALFVQGRSSQAERAWKQAQKLSERIPSRVWFISPPSYFVLQQSGPSTLDVRVGIALSEPPGRSAGDVYTVTLSQDTKDGTVDLEKQVLQLDAWEPEAQGQLGSASFLIAPRLQNCSILLRAGQLELIGLFSLTLSRQPANGLPIQLVEYPFAVSGTTCVRVQLETGGMPIASGAYQAVYGVPVPIRAQIGVDLPHLAGAESIALAGATAASSVAAELEVQNSLGAQVQRLGLTPIVEDYSQHVSFQNDLKPVAPGNYRLRAMISDIASGEFVMSSTFLNLEVVAPTSTPTASPTPVPAPTPSLTPTPLPPRFTLASIMTETVGYDSQHSDIPIYTFRPCELVLVRQAQEGGRSEVQPLELGTNTIWVSSQYYEIWSVLTAAKIRAKGHVATCRREQIVYMPERDGSLTLPLSDCFRDCVVFDLLEKDEDWIRIHGKAGDRTVDGWVKAEDMVLYDLVQIELP